MEILNKICDFLDSKFQTNGAFETFIDGLAIFKADSPSEYTAALYEPSICLALQGSKSVKIGNEKLIYDNNKFLISATHLPATGSITGCPFKALRLSFSMDEIFEVIQQMPPQKVDEKAKGGMFLADRNEEILNVLWRLISLLDKPEQDAKFLSSLARKEILYTLLNGDGGDFLRAYAQIDSMQNKVSKAAKEIRENYNKALNIDNIARKLGISSSSLYHNFKKLTSYSPLQFQKHVRLQEAKNLLLFKGMGVANTAFAVGYESPSQFSKEYAKMYGMPPSTHAQSVLEV